MLPYAYVFSENKNVVSLVDFFLFILYFICKSILLCRYICGAVVILYVQNWIRIMFMNVCENWNWKWCVKGKRWGRWWRWKSIEKMLRIETLWLHSGTKINIHFHLTFHIVHNLMHIHTRFYYLFLFVSDHKLLRIEIKMYLLVVVW